jgi:hypothetical protein
MKKLFKFSALLVIAIFFSNCNENNDEKKEVLNSEQIILNEFIINKCNGCRGNKNDIQRDEYITKYKEEFKNLSDSIKIIENWKGKIVRIDLSNWDSFGQTEINADIEYELSEYQKITFKSKRFFKKKNIDSNLLYRQLKELKVGQSIYFSGIFGKDKDNNIEFDIFMTDTDNEIVCSPKVVFNLASVTLDKLSFTETESFIISSNQLYKSWEYMNGRIRGKYSQSELSRELTLNAKLVKPYSLKFTKEEKDYYQSLTDCFKINFDK